MTSFIKYAIDDPIATISYWYKFFAELKGGIFIILGAPNYYVFEPAITVETSPVCASVIEIRV